MVTKMFNIGTCEATSVLNCVICDTANEIQAKKLKCAEDCHICSTMYQNLSLWFDSWEVFLVDYGFATYDMDGVLIINEELKKQILNLDKTCISLNGNDSNQGGCPTTTYYNVCFLQFGKAMQKSALTTLVGVPRQESPSPPLSVSDFSADCQG